MTHRVSKRWARPFIAPSILSADFANLESEIRSVEKGGAQWLHIDVMDGHFVPNITIGPLVVEAIRPKTKLKLDCHLMVEKPHEWIEPFSKAGADVITVHIEATDHAHRYLKKIRDLGCKAGISINPATPLVAIEEVLPIVDLVLIMAVNPGFGGQKFIEEALNKVQRLAEIRAALKPKNNFLIEVDGGVNLDNAAALREAGCDVFVAGSAIFSAKDRAKQIRLMKSKIGV